MPTIVVDANVMVSALLGRSFPMLLDLLEAGGELVAPVQQLAETRARLKREQADAADFLMAQLLEVIEPIEAVHFEAFEEVATARLEPRGRPDWPVLAAALRFEAPILSNDRDFFGVGVPVWKTRNAGFLKEQLGAYSG